MQNTTSSTPANTDQFPRLSRWLDMFDEAVGINQPQNTQQ